MAWGVGDLIRLKLEATYLQVTVLNVLWFRVTVVDAGVNLPEALDIITDNLISAMIPVQNQDFDNVRQVWENMTNEIDINVLNYQNQGLIPTVAPTPSYFAIGMTKTVPSKLTRPGGFRLVGLEEDINAGNAVNPAALPALQVVANELGYDQVGTDSNDLTVQIEPVVVSLGVDGKPIPGKVQRISGVGNFKVTTQNTRKNRI